MAVTPSTMLELGTQAPDFNLPDVVSGDTVSLDSFSDKKALLIMFICQHCPFVIHIQDELARLGNDYANQSLGILAISSNSIKTHPMDAPDNLKAQAEQTGFNFPYGYDESQDVAKTYKAACTPDFFLLDGERKLTYRGQLDDSRPGNNKPVNGADLRAAIDSVLNDLPVNPDQKSSVGCNIKWHPGNEPDYF